MNILHPFPARTFHFIDWPPVRRSGPVSIRILGHRNLDLRDIDGQVRTVRPGEEITIDGRDLDTLEAPDFEIVREPAGDGD